MAIDKLQGKWVLVTGAASGIGFETARTFADEGANIVLVDINEEALQRARQSIASSAGVHCESFALDVGDEAAVRSMAEQLLSAIGSLDVLVNNAGIGFLGPMLHTPTPAWRHVLDVNLMGVVHFCQAFIPAMLERGRPCHVVNVASAAGIHATPNLSAYSASKHAVMGLHESLAMELIGRCVGLSVVCPGVINTPIVRNRKAMAPMVPEAQMDKLDAYYRKNGASPAVVGRSIVRAVKKGESQVLVGPTAQAIERIKRLSPSLARKAMLMGCKRNGYWWRYDTGVSSHS